MSDTWVDLDQQATTVRISWQPDGTKRTAAVNKAIAAAFAAGNTRVETWLPRNDAQNRRVAMLAGLRLEGVARRVDQPDLLLYARLSTDPHPFSKEGNRALLNSTLPRKRAIAQMLIQDETARVLLCRLTYKDDWDLPGGVLEVGESPAIGASREVKEELGFRITAGELLLTDWLPAWSGWDDAICLVFDGGIHPADLVAGAKLQAKEIAEIAFCTPAEIAARASEITTARIISALDSTKYSEAGQPLN